MLSISAFLLRFPQFSTTPTALVQAKIDEAALFVDPNIWKTRADVGHGYLAAHLLVADPSGQNARLVAKDGMSTYKAMFDILKNVVATGGLTI